MSYNQGSFGSVLGQIVKLGTLFVHLLGMMKL